MSDDILAKDKIGGCRYVIKIKGKMLVCEMRGYGLKATETEKLKTRKHDHFAFDAAALRDKMVRLERRMHDLARLTEQLKSNGVSGVARLPETSVRRKAKGVNPLTALMAKV